MLRGHTASGYSIGQQGSRSPVSRAGLPVYGENVGVNVSFLFSEEILFILKFMFFLSWNFWSNCLLPLSMQWWWYTDGNFFVFVFKMSLFDKIIAGNARPVKKIYTYIKRKYTYMHVCVHTCVYIYTCICLYMYMYNMLVYEIIIIKPLRFFSTLVFCNCHWKIR